MAGEDLISNLPEPILHHCLSFLPTKDATRTSILSKKWKSIWDLFPILNFDQPAFEMSLLQRRSSHPHGLTEMFLEYLSSSIKRRRWSSKLQKFRLVADLRGHRSDGRLNKAIKFAVEGDVQELELSISVQVHEFFKPPKHLYSAKSVTILKLKNLKVELDNLMRGCPLLEELRVQSCQVPQDIKIVSDKLKTFELNNCPYVRSLTMEAINLESLIFVGEFTECCLTITACKSLKMLSLQRTLIKYQWLEDVISKLVLLETLDLDFCIGLYRVKVCHQQLRSFKICVCDEEELHEVNINTPKLRWFLYHGKPERFGIFNSSGVLGAMLSLHKPDDINTIQWFNNLREFLLLFGHCKVLNLACDTQKDLITSKELRDGFLPPLYDLKHLSIEISYQDSVNYAELVDTLLWLSPHLETLVIVSRDKQISLKFEREKMETEEIFCCGEYPKDCWKYYLKKVTVIFYKGIKDDKEDLFAYFRQQAKSLESVDDVSISLPLPKKEYVSQKWKEVQAGRWQSRAYFQWNS